MTGLRVRVFGKLRLQNGQATVDFFPTRHVEELLGFLLINRNVHHAREKLIEILWPGDTLANGRANLSTVLWRARAVFKQLGVSSDEYLKSARDWVSLEPSQPIKLDLVDFERKLAEAEQTKNSSKRDELLHAALDLYQGRLFEGIYAEWCLVERERLERCYLRTLGQLMSSLIQREKYGEAVAIGQNILQRDPLREEVHRALMLCFWKKGDRANGVRQFQVCSRHLQEELQIMPMPETIALYRWIIEERIETAGASNGARATRYQRRLKVAYNKFQAAADNLNAILDKAPENPEQPVSG